MTPALQVRCASVALAGRAVLSGVDIDVRPGEIVGVLGANGAGKTTLLRAALGLTPLAAGDSSLFGAPVHRLGEAERARRVGYLPQERRVGWNMPAWRIAALGAPGLPPAQAHRRALDALELVGLADLAGRGVLDMSGGERARVLVARLIATHAPLLVADEPVAGLDPDAQFRILEILRDRADGGAGVLLTLHDLSLAARTCDRLAILAKGRLVAFAPPREALSSGVLATAFSLDGALLETPAGLVLAARRAAPASIP